MLRFLCTFLGWADRLFIFRAIVVPHTLPWDYYQDRCNKRNIKRVYGERGRGVQFLAPEKVAWYQLNIAEVRRRLLSIKERAGDMEAGTEGDQLELLVL